MTDAIAEKVKCWACFEMFASGDMVDGYVLGPVCQPCDKLLQEEDEEAERLAELDDAEAAV